MQPVPICISPSRKFEEAFVKRWRKERRTLLHFFVVYDLKGGCFDLFRVEDSKIQTKKWKFQFKHFPVGYLCFPFLAEILASSNFFGSSKVSMLSKIFGKNIRKKFPANTNTNTNIIRFEKITRIRIRIIFGLKNYPNTNTNNIRFEKITRIRIRIIFGFKKSPEYEYEY